MGNRVIRELTEADHPDLRDLRQDGLVPRYVVYGGEYTRYASCLQDARKYAERIVQNIYADLVNTSSFDDALPTIEIVTPLYEIDIDVLAGYGCVMYACVAAADDERSSVVSIAYSEDGVWYE